jgi:electron transfer flavoprotein alpha subunit
MTLPENVRTLAVITVREAELPLGAEETVAEADGVALLAGSGTRAASAKLGCADRVWLAEHSSVGPGRLAATLAPRVSTVGTVVLPGSPDGRDMAPRLAAILNRPLFANAVQCTSDEVELTRLDDRVSVRVAMDEPSVVTLRPGVRGIPEPTEPARTADVPPCAPSAARDAETVEVLQPDPTTADLAEARRILGGGAGLVPAEADGAATMHLLADVAAALGASAGATRVVTDAGWMPYDRQIGTTGVAVQPDLYIALGISGAAQHVGGLGHPECVVSVNTDASCPMTAMADLGILADAPAVLAELARRLRAAREAIPTSKGATGE